MAFDLASATPVAAPAGKVGVPKEDMGAYNYVASLDREGIPARASVRKGGGFEAEDAPAPKGGGFDLASAKPVAGPVDNSAPRGTMPASSEVPNWEFGKPPPGPVAKPKLFSIGDTLKGANEAIVGGAASAAAAPIGAAAGMISAPFRDGFGKPEGARRGAEIAQNVSGAIARPFQPQSDQGQDILGWLSKMFEQSKLGGLNPAQMQGPGAMMRAPRMPGGVRPGLTGSPGELPPPPPAAAAAARPPGPAPTLPQGQMPPPRPAPQPGSIPEPPPLDPRAEGRVAQMASLPVPIKDATRGQLTRDPVQLRKETQLSQTDAGAPLRDLYLGHNEDLLANLDTLRGRTGMRAKSEQEVGRRVAGEAESGRPGAEGALTRAASESDKNINRLYRVARQKGEMEKTLPLDPLLEHLRTHDNPSTVGFIPAKLKALKLIESDEYGNLQPTHPITLNQLEEIRKAASTAARTSSDGTIRHYAGEAVGEIDKMIPDTAGGKAYQAARSARREHAMRFEEPKAVDQLIGQKSRTDRATALEDVWKKTVTGGSISDLERVRSTLLDSADRQTRDSGRKAWRDLAGQTVEYIKQESTKAAALDERGNPNVAPAALKKALDTIGEDKLRVLLGDTASKQLRDLAEVTADLKTKPPTRLGGSDTSVNLMTKLDKVLDHVPILGGVARGAVRMGAKAYREGQASGQVREALSRPTQAPPAPPKRQVGYGEIPPPP